MEQIAAQINAEQFREARIELLNLVQDDTSDNEARLLLVGVLEQLGQLDQARSHYNELIRVGVQTPELLMIGARVLHRLGRFAELHESLTAGPLVALEQPAHTRYLGEALLALRKYDELDALLQGTDFDAANDKELTELQARLLLRQGRTEEATRSLEALEAAHPQFGPAWLTRGQLHLLLGEFAEAGNAFGKAEEYAVVADDAELGVSALVGQFDAALLANDVAAAEATLGRLEAVTPNSGLTRFAVARMSAHKGDAKLAIDQLNGLVQAWPGYAPAHSLLGSLYLADSAYGLAEVHLRRAMEIDPSANDARANLLRLQIAQGENSEAQATLSELVRSAPNWVQGMVIQAMLEAQNGDLEKSLELAGKLEPLLGSAAMANEVQGDVLLATGHFSEAAAAYDRVLESEMKRNVVVKAFQAKANFDTPQAERLIEEWLIDNSEDHVMRFMLAQHQQSTGDLAMSAVNYATLVEAIPNNPALLNNFAWVRHELGDPEAVTYAKSAHSLAPDNGAIADTLGWLMLQTGDLDGVEYIEQAIAQYPESMEIRYHLAVARAKQGRVADALSELDLVLEDETPANIRLAAEELANELR